MRFRAVLENVKDLEFYRQMDKRLSSGTDGLLLKICVLTRPIEVIQMFRLYIYVGYID